MKVQSHLFHILKENARWFAVAGAAAIAGLFLLGQAGRLEATGEAQERGQLAAAEEGCREAAGSDRPSTPVFGREVRAASRTVPSEPAPAPPLLIQIDLTTQRLTLFSQGKPFKTYPVAIGKPRTPSPIGEWAVVHKSRDWGGGFGTRWLGLNVPWGIYGIHGTNKPGSIGTRASAGCFRMFNRDVEELFSWVPQGTPVHVVGPIAWPARQGLLREGQSGQAIAFLQLRLKEFGQDLGPADARYGPATKQAVRNLEGFFGLPVDGVADPDLYAVLRLR